MNKEEKRFARKLITNFNLYNGEQQTPHSQQDEKDGNKEKLHFNFTRRTLGGGVGGVGGGIIDIVVCA